MSESELATLYKANVRTVRRWKKLAAPVDKPEEMKVWLSARKRIPAGTADFITGGPAPARCVPPPNGAKRRRPRVGGDALHPRPIHVPVAGQGADQTVRGAAAALKRLAEAELAANTEYLATLGDPESTAEEVEDARNAWVKLSESLRKFDLAVEIARRDAGELVPRGIVEVYAQNIAVNFIGSVKASFESMVPRLAGLATPQDIGRVLLPAFDRALAEALKNVAARPFKAQATPDWLVKALAEVAEVHL